MISETCQCGRRRLGRTAGIWEFKMRTQTFAGSLEKQMGPRLVWFNLFRRNIVTSEDLVQANRRIINNVPRRETNLNLFEGYKQVLFTFPAYPFKPNLTASSFVHFPHFLVPPPPKPKCNGVHVGVLAKRLASLSCFFILHRQNQTLVWHHAAEVRNLFTSSHSFLGTYVKMNDAP